MGRTRAVGSVVRAEPPGLTPGSGRSSPSSAATSSGTATGDAEPEIPHYTCDDKQLDRDALAHTRGGVYQVRTWGGWHLQALSLVAAWFLTQEAQRGK